MDKKALDKARSRLRVAQKAAEDLKGCKDHDQFTDTWYTFLTSTKNIYTVLEQGAKVSPQSRQWYGRKAAERRGDDLLQYLYEARNDDEHGLEPISQHVPGSLAIGVSKPGFSNAVRLDGRIGPGGTLNVQSLDGKPVLIEQTFEHVRLVPINARGHRIIPVPKVHLGKALTNSAPMTIALIALNYFSGMLQEAEGLA